MIDIFLRTPKYRVAGSHLVDDDGIAVFNVVHKYPQSGVVYIIGRNFFAVDIDFTPAGEVFAADNNISGYRSGDGRGRYLYYQRMAVLFFRICC